MNELNYASLEASKKLVDNGIKLDTDCFYKIGDGDGLFDYDHYDAEYMDYPAPSMAEVWRELPKESTLCMGGNGETYAMLEQQDPRDSLASLSCNTNPTDALIELLVWVKGAGK